MIEFKAKVVIPEDVDIAVTYTERAVNFKAHMHDFVEMVYIASGSCRHFVNGVSYDVKQGDLIYIGIGETHAFESTETVASYEMHIRPKLLLQQMLSDDPSNIFAFSLFHEFSDEISSISPCVSFEDTEELNHLFAYALKEYESTEAGKDCALKGYFLVILTKFLRQIRKKQMYHVDRHIQKVMPKILDYIEKNYCKSLSLEELAEQSFYNPTYFSRIFKELYGKTLTEYISGKRIKEAVRLLENSTLTVDEICQKIGYNDKKHFYKIFKDSIGLTPGQYRRETVERNKKE